MLSKDMHVVLECGLDAREAPSPAPARTDVSEKPAKSVGPTKPITTKPAEVDTSIERRLRKLNALHKKGLVTDQEYRDIRKRILDEL